jgi:hypothetical protein
MGEGRVVATVLPAWPKNRGGMRMISPGRTLVAAVASLTQWPPEIVTEARSARYV